MGNIGRIARQIIKAGRQTTGDDQSIPDDLGMAKIPPRPARSGLVCPQCDGDAEESGTPGRISCFFCGYTGPAA